jgi:trk system potassium uptake protein TrkH
LFKQARRETKRLIHPNIVAHIKYHGRVVPDEVCNGVMGFFALWVLTAAISTLLMMACGLSPIAAFGAVSATINNMGIGLNEVASSFAGVTLPGKWVLILTMLIGRLEIFTVFALFVPLFWRKF